METTCRHAIDIGLRAIAFTEHADHVPQVHETVRPLDILGYHAEVERCRALFPGLRILSGVELGEPHRYPRETAAVIAAGRLDRVLGSVHCFEWRGRLMDASQLASLPLAELADAVRVYFKEVCALVGSAQPFEVLAHLDYPKRYWPHPEICYRELEFEEEIREVLRSAAARQAVLEMNTTRGEVPERGLCPGPTVLGWWVEAGGRALSFGSDSHEPGKIARGFALAAQLAEAAGFKPNDDPAAFWRR